jgi:hypothetical protein
MTIPVFSATAAIFYFGWLWQNRSSAEQRNLLASLEIQEKEQRRKVAQRRPRAANCSSIIRLNDSEDQSSPIIVLQPRAQSQAEQSLYNRLADVPVNGQ